MDLSQLYLEAKAFNDGSIIAADGKREMESEKCFQARRTGWRLGVQETVRVRVM